MGLPYDAGGRISSRGLFSQSLLEKMLRHPYFKKKPPKSTGRELFNRGFLKPWERELGRLTLEDQMATLCELSAYSLYQDLKRFTPNVPEKIFVAGGGAQNKDLLKRLRSYLPQAEVLTSDVLGWPTEAIEAGAFAYLALMRFLQKPVPLASITGGRDVLLGSVNR